MTDGFPVPGEVFEGRYRISALIGSGGFARVYSAVQEDLGRDVAIKILMPATSSDGNHYSEKIVRRFNQEARLVSRLRDPHTITMFDYGETDNGLLYMVFEYIEGRSLSQIVHEDGAIEPSRVVKVLEATLSSLQEAHAFGVLHRDIKPGNIMMFDYLGRPDQVKLLDFGIAKSLSDKVPGKDITADGALVGTPRYMSPEQIRGQQLGPASDIYSLGLVAFEMLTGYKAIDSNSSVTIIGRQLDSAPFSLPEEIEVPDGLREIVNRMMAKQMETRFETAEEVLDALRDFREGKYKSVAVPVEEELPALTVEPIDQPAHDNTFDSSPALDRKRLAGIIALCLLLVGAIVVMLTIGSNEESQAEESPEFVDGVAVAAKGVAETTARSAEEIAADGEADSQEELMTVLIATTPRVAQVTVNGESLGESPTPVEVGSSDFPLEIVVSIGDRELETTLEAFDDEIIIDVNDLIERPKSIANKDEPADDDNRVATKKAAERKPERKAPRPKPKSKPKPKPEPEPEPAKKNPIFIPALD